MEHRREFKEDEATVPLLVQQVPSAHEEEEEEGEAEESPQVHKSFFSDPSPPTRDDWILGRGRGREISALLGAMRPLLGKLGMLLLAPPQGCSNSKRVKDGMRLLKDDVEKMSSCLDQLSELEDPPPRAKCWMNEARDLSYDMEDYIDSLIFVRPEDPSLVPNNIKTTRSRLKFRSHLKLFGHAKTPKTQAVIIAETLSEFKMYVQEAIERHQRYGLHSCSTLRRRFVSLGPMLLPTTYEDIVIDGRMNGFIKSLAEDGNQQLKALSVLGPACIGKTTLAKVLYNRLGKQYHCRAFIQVSKKPDMKTILCDMLSQLQRQHPSQHYMEIDLVHNIKQYLQDKRYLIIIDDIWATSVWDTINHAFPKGSQGSRIVTTTQIEDVAIACCCYQSDHVFEMKPLDDDHSRKLFFNIIFGAESDCPEELKEVSNKILEICDGLPLATISIASLVASQPVMSIDLLTYIHQSLCSCFSANSTSEITRQVLSLSYNNLPHYLKTCLLYLSMYQEGYTFCKDDLLKQWVAEGLIDTTEGQDIEKVAESYLHQLIGRKFIQPIGINYNNEVLSCAVHDAVYDLIAHKSAEEYFIVAIDYSCRKSVALSQKARRLSLIFGDARYAKIPSNIRKSQVRSLRFFGLLESMPCITEFKLLRVLNLQLFGHRQGDQGPAVDLTGISELFHLRYLKIACDVCIKLPNCMRGLQSLETLDVMDTTRGTHVPWDIIYLPHLLHLSLPVDTNLLDWSVSLGSLGMLNHLRDLYISTPPSPNHLERSIGYVERRMEALGSLIGGHGTLKTMVVAHASSVKYGGASKATIYWNNIAPPPHLQIFECSPHNGIIFYEIPRWMEQLGNLCILKIAVSELLIYDVGILRGLPTLTVLSLYLEKAPYDKIIFDKVGFSVLKYFKLRFTSGIALLKFETDAMPNLLKLKLVFNAIPQMDQYEQGIISIDHMPGLREIMVRFGGVAVGPEYDLVSNHQRNPRINKQQQTYEILEEERDEIVEEERDELKRPADKRNSILTESSSRPHVPEDQAGWLESGGNKEPSHPGKAPVLKLGSLSWTEDDLSQAVATMSLHDFTVDDLKLATNNFNIANLEGVYCSGGTKIYKGSIDGNLCLRDFSPQHFFVMYRAHCNRGEDHDWLAGPVYLQTKKHPHLVKLLGFCKEYPHSFLVYEYMPGGTLKNHIDGLLASIPWITRLKIAVGTAKGLAFLHEVGTPMISGDFDASNILLDSDYTAKLLGYRLAKENPLYTTPGTLAEEKDVYNFGVVLLEMLAGRPSVDEKQPSWEEDLVEWASSYLYSKHRVHRIMDPSLKGRYSLSAAFSTATIVCRCLRSVPQERPSMRDVVEALEPLPSDDRNDGPEPKPKETKFKKNYTGSRAKRPAGGEVQGRGKAKQAEELEEFIPIGGLFSSGALDF